MMTMRVYSIVVAVLVVCCGHACQAQKTTVDPNSGPALPTIELSKTDPRLAQKVTYETWHTPVKVILADLSKLTGVTLNAGVNKQDWQVRDRKMNICVEEVTLAQLMNSISRVMKFKWSKNDKAAPVTYRLYADRKLIGQLQAESSRRANELKQEVRKRRAKLVEVFKELSSASEADIQSLKEENPYLYMCAETGFAGLVTQIFSELPELSNIFISGDKNLIPPVSTLSQSTQQLMADALKKSYAYNSILRGSPKLPDDMDKQLPGRCIHLSLVPRPYEGDVCLQLSDFGGVGTNFAIDGVTIFYRIGTFMDPDSEFAQTLAKSATAAAEEGQDSEQFYKQQSSTLDAVRRESAKEAEYYLMFDPIIEQPDEPGLDKKISVKINDEAAKLMQEQLRILGDGALPRLKYQAIQKTIAKAADLSIVSDSFAVIIGEYQPKVTEDELNAVLEDFTGEYGCNWEKHGSVLEIRRRDWFRRRASQIPDEWVKYWRDELAQAEILSLDSYARIITLSPEQQEENIDSDPVLHKATGIWWEHLDNEGLMRFYLHLSPFQRDLLFSEKGLDSSMIGITQWPLYAEMFHYGRRSAWRTEAFGDPANPSTLKASATMYKEDRLGINRYLGTNQYEHILWTATVEVEGETKNTQWEIYLQKIPRPAVDKTSGGSANE